MQMRPMRKKLSDGIAKPERFRDVPRYLYLRAKGFFTRLFYIISLVITQKDINHSHTSIKNVQCARPPLLYKEYYAMMGRAVFPMHTSIHLLLFHQLIM